MANIIISMLSNAEVIATARTGELSLVVTSGIKRSKHPDGISSPLKTRLSKPERICSRPNATEVNIDPQNSNVFMQLGHPRRAQKPVARVSDQPHIVRSFLAPNRKINDQMLCVSRNL